jgi:hypothetical protein
LIRQLHLNSRNSIGNNDLIKNWNFRIKHRTRLKLIKD